MRKKQLSFYSALSIQEIMSALAPYCYLEANSSPPGIYVSLYEGKQIQIEINVRPKGRQGFLPVYNAALYPVDSGTVISGFLSMTTFTLIAAVLTYVLIPFINIFIIICLILGITQPPSTLFLVVWFGYTIFFCLAIPFSMKPYKQQIIDFIIEKLNAAAIDPTDQSLS